MGAGWPGHKYEILFRKIPAAKRGEDVAPVVKHLPSKKKAMSSTTTTKGWVHLDV
jgi:hypothetical protein